MSPKSAFVPFVAVLAVVLFALHFQTMALTLPIAGKSTHIAGAQGQSQHHEGCSGSCCGDMSCCPQVDMPGALFECYEPRQTFPVTSDNSGRTLTLRPVHPPPRSHTG